MEIVRIATDDDMQIVKYKLSKMEEKFSIFCERNIADIRKRAYQEGWKECNSEAYKFCNYIVEVLASKSPVEIEEFFDIKDSFQLYKRLEHVGVLEWDRKLNAFVPTHQDR